MKKLLCSFVLGSLLTTFATNLVAQTPGVTELFCEDFDSTVTKWKMTPSRVNANPVPWFWQTDVTKNGSRGAAADTIANYKKSYLLSPNIYIGGLTAINLSFDHICYIEDLEGGTVDYSWDGGTTWDTVPVSAYNGTSRYDRALPGIIPPPWEAKFTKFSRGGGQWKDTDSTYLWDSINSIPAWVREDFNMSNVVAARPASANDSIMFRLVYEDRAASTKGRVGEHIWYVDNFCVVGGNCDLVPPVVTLTDPPQNYSTRYEDRVYLSGPWIFDVVVTDNRGQVDSVYVPYWVLRPNLGGGMDTIIVDTVPALRLPGNNFRGVIQPSLPNGGSIALGDSVVWKVEARDGSACVNLAQDPPDGVTSFLVKPTLPPSCREADILYTFPYYETFEGTEFNAPSTTAIGGGWSNVSGDFHNWWLWDQPSSAQGAFRIITDHPGGGNYLYVESSKPNGDSFKDSSAFLLSPCFDFTEISNGLLRFYANTNTATVNDSIRIDVFVPTPKPGFPNGQFVKNVIPAAKGNRGDKWLAYEFSTFPFQNYITQIRFVGTPSNNQGNSDMAIDSFKIIPSALIDIRTNSVIIAPFVPCRGNAPEQEMIMNVQNLGIASASNFTMSYEIYKAPMTPGSSPIVPSVYNYQPNVTLTPGENRDISFGVINKYTVPCGPYTIKAWVTFANDGVPQNDTTFNNSTGVFYKDGKKYMDDFDKDTIWTVFIVDDSTNNKWEIGTPNYDYTYSAYTGVNSWDVLLNRGYTGTGRTATLLTPFLDFTNVDDAIVSFINNRDINKTRDGVFIDYSFDRGITWDSLPALHDAGRKRWNNSFLSAGGFGGQPVMSGTTYCWGNTWNGYLESELQLPTIFNNKPEVLLRFNFFAEVGGVGNDGMSIDNFLVYDPEQLDLQVQHFVSPTSRCDLQVDQKISTVIKNRGLATVTSFTMEYTIRRPDSTIEVKTDVINRTIAHRDTIHVTSQSTFDMFGYGDYIVEAKAILTNDFCALNDAITKTVENVKGCSLLFNIETTGRPNIQGPCDSSVWKFNYTSSDGRSYQISQAYNDPRNLINLPFGRINQKINNLSVCMKSDSKVTFRLDDKDGLIDNYSFIAFNGDSDTILFSEVPGGEASPIQRFDWNCPPERSATPIRIILDNDKVQLPVEKRYDVSVNVLNNGLDSLDSMKVYFRIDDQPVIERIVRHPFPLELKYNRTRVVNFQDHLLTEGAHTLCAWTELPNGKPDLQTFDDLLCIPFTVMSTVPAIMFGSSAEPDSPMNSDSYCVDFEDPLDIPWITASPYTLLQLNPLFEKGTPSSTNIRGAFSGTQAWGTRLDTNYLNQDEGMLLSPLFPVVKDSCYKISFKHNFYIGDSIHDGGTVRMLNSNDITNYSDVYWDQVGRVQVKDTISLNPLIVRDIFLTPLGDTIFQEQNGWYTTRHILSIPDNTKNSGWTGISNGWITAESVLRPTKTFNTAVMWRFESDGSIVSDGWAIDDFCIEQLPPSSCYPLSIDKNAIEENSIYLGQNMPNPASGNTVIPIYLPVSGDVSFRVINLLGQPVYEELNNRPRGDGLIELNTSSMAAGFYYYTLYANGKSLTKKMVINK
jgi:hypothetical protein